MEEAKNRLGRPLAAAREERRSFEGLGFEGVCTPFI